ncbi:YgfZ/GcvT domain-containing protein [Pelagicoccus mobilis]|uniref:GCVT N-terminal domain-containing protein n=1 Tax=Pelagicoccus mobilis TaxID=415221 RepID=A0A934RU32_9BACT|nr:hypothetical protein [Pelagicoccus mobilis]MBK1876887.1 hypothetical protein [Pelagicoccus mobilis]
MRTRRFYSYQPGCVLRASGPDAAEFLQGQFSNDLSKMAAGDVVYGLWLDRKGKIVADSFVLRRGDEEFLLVSYHCAEGAVFERLDAYLIMEEVELEGCSSLSSGVGVFGEISAIEEDLEVAIPETGKFCEEDGVIAFWGRRSDEPCLEILAIATESKSKFEGILEGVRSGGAVELVDDEMAEMAIRSKVPRIGISFGERDLPQELGLEVDAVSFSKGCYLGQEVMARLHAMGRVRKALAVLSIDETVTREFPLDLVDAGGKRQGSLREVVYPKTGGVGLGVLNLSFVEGDLYVGETLVRRVDTEETGHE